MVLTEAERQFYLGVAGIRMWYAREPLAGAAPSPEFQFPAETEVRPWLESAPSDLPEPAPAQARGAAAVRVADLQSLVTEGKRAANRVMKPSPAALDSGKTGRVSEPARPEPERAPVPDASTEAGTLAPTQPLQLQLWLGERFALLAKLSDETSLRLQETLAVNILASLGEEAPEGHGPVHWPVFNNPLVPGCQVEDLVAIVGSLLEPVSGRRLLLLGLPEWSDGGQGGHWLARAGNWSPSLVFPHSLAELAGQPALKRALWQRLKPLVAC